MKTIHVQSPSGLSLALHRFSEPAAAVSRGPVLYIHGATFPAALSVGYRFDGYSWADDLAAAGFDVWGLDFAGFGQSERYPDRDTIPGRVAEAVEQMEAAVEEILTRDRVEKLSVVAHSWGTLVAGAYAASHPETIDRLVLFGPIARRANAAGQAVAARFQQITLQDQYDRFIADVPKGEPPVLSEDHFATWGQEYLASDGDSGDFDPAAVTVPGGPGFDIAEAWRGQFPYDPGRIECPVLIVRGEWDSLTGDADAAWLFGALTNAAARQDVKISRATHLMHLESGRFDLYAATRAFLRAGREASTRSSPPIAVIFEVAPAEGRQDDYLAIAAELRPMLEKIDGFISIERFQSLADPKKILSLSFFRDEAAIRQWRTLDAHRAAQTKGRSGIFSGYRLRIASVIRDYGMSNRDHAPDDSKKIHR